MRSRLAVLVAFAPAAVVVLVALKSLGEPLRAADVFWHLAMGRIIATTGQIPTTDIFSFTRAGAPFFDQAWLGQVVLFTVHRAGLEVLLAMNFAWMLAACALTTATARERGATGTSAALALALLAPVAMRGFAVRPQALAVPLFAAFVHVLSTFRTKRQWRWSLTALPLLAVLWANLHGSFPLACVLVLTTLLAIAVDDLAARRAGGGRATSLRDTARLGLVMLGCAAAPIVNPRGAAIYGYVASLLQNPSVHEVAPEWRHVGFGTSEGITVIVVLAIATWVLVRRRAWGDLLVVAPFAALELSAVRNGIWLYLVLAPIAATWLRFEPTARAARAGWRLAAAFAMVLALVPWVKPHILDGPYGQLLWRTPVAATLAIARDTSRPRRLFHDASAGSYLVWALPAQPVFIDTRLELYPLEQWRDLGRLLVAEDVPRLLDAYGIDALLIDKRLGAPLVSLERTDPRFVLRYEDESHAYFAARQLP